MLKSFIQHPDDQGGNFYNIRINTDQRSDISAALLLSLDFFLHDHVKNLLILLAICMVTVLTLELIGGT
jgi:hypothetical protein